MKSIELTVKDCYEEMEGTYEEVLERLGNDERIKKYLRKFLSDPNYEALRKAVEAEDYKNAFVCVHNMKGVCENLAITRLAESASVLCESLRGGHPAENPAILLEEVIEDYDRAVKAIKCLLV